MEYRNRIRTVGNEMNTREMAAEHLRAIGYQEATLDTMTAYEIEQISTAADRAAAGLVMSGFEQRLADLVPKPTTETLPLEEKESHGN